MAATTDWVPGSRLFPWDSPIVHDNLSFELLPEHSYDELPDIKAYLALLGSPKPSKLDEPAIPWFWRPPGTTFPLSQQEVELKERCDAAVRRGVQQLLRRRERNKGYARSYSLWYPYSWIPSSPWAGVQPGYEGDFRSECLAEGCSDDGTGLSLSADMLRASTRRRRSARSG
ncbi:hypothetical protein A1Q1_03643 [Trichosporon asahii var. asahii CBS 2479]|uniref:Uncharacterized protein n=1 Tax=Trichosporon asahii var. asahii (strain ATCC 90039 / CBS 2479 / JCM 2466 / KCTC 7840 / NBRC 103889/ NCYC 2677 / UAMH 7654) TaxID=1186058 RepID=J5SU51_TRIAS|nr:hypothetical protein A1Q1_03643 [Trichosporon asahii var. asahii CBS 2479]EJT47531.1 hypothetical protein A1Q1_03643 [Trichosporon asahii var. asahii CBS 2479]